MQHSCAPAAARFRTAPDLGGFAAARFLLPAFTASSVSKNSARVCCNYGGIKSNGTQHSPLQQLIAVEPKDRHAGFMHGGACKQTLQSCQEWGCNTCLSRLRFSHELHITVIVYVLHELICCIAAGRL